MVTKFRFKGHDVTLGTVGMMRIMAEETGKDGINPLEGITDTLKQAAYILYAGKAFEDVESDMPISTPFKEAQKIVDSWTLVEAIALTKKYAQVLSEAVTEAEGDMEQVEDRSEKKSRPSRK